MSLAEEGITSKTEQTFQYDKDLLTLPVPELESTANKYLESVKNLVSEEEYRNTEKIVHQFISTDGKYLQKKLIEKAKTERNWLAKWWEDVAYLEARLSAPLMNMAGPGPYAEDNGMWPAKMGSQLERGGLSLHLVLCVWQHLRRQTYKPHMDGKKRPIDMFQFRRIFNTCTIPGVSKDYIKMYFKTEDEGDCPSHIAVIHKGHTFFVNVLDESGEVLTAPELEALMTTIKERCQGLGPAQGVNLLTAEERTKWAQARNEIVALHPQNFEVLEKIQSAIIHVWLESGPGGDAVDELSALTNNALLGNGENRWFDKSLSSGVYEDGLFVSAGDHTPAEGMLLVYVTDYVHKKLLEWGGKWPGTSQKRPLPEPEQATFVLNDSLVERIEEARVNYAQMRQLGKATVFQYRTFGKSYCKTKRIHPDAVCQLAFHLGYYMMYGKMGAAYETAPTKQYYRGRTETHRSCTPEVRAWCEAMVNPKVEGKQKLQLFASAIKKHLFDFQEACEGRGIDRHFLGLVCVAREEGKPIPELFLDPSFVKSGGGGNYTISTSCIGYTSVLGGVLPMCENGYGIFYRINDNKFTYYMTSWNADVETDNDKLGASIWKAFDHIKALVERGTSSTTAKL